MSYCHWNMIDFCELCKQKQKKIVQLELIDCRPIISGAKCIVAHPTKFWEDNGPPDPPFSAHALFRFWAEFCGFLPESF